MDELDQAAPDRAAEFEALPPDDEDVEEGVDRRKFLARGTLSIGVVLAAGWTVPAAAYVFGPARKSDTTEEWVSLGAANKVPVGEPTLFKTTVVRATGWVTSEEEIAVYVLTEDGRTYTGLSNVCTHLGCRVRWVDDSDGFFCPCHNAVFSKDGSVATGPPPRALDAFELKVEDGQLFVKLEV